MPGFIHFPACRGVTQTQIVERYQPVIGPCRHRQGSVIVEQVIDKIEVRAAIVEAGVYMGEIDIDQLLGPIDTGGADNDLHRELHRLAELAGKAVLIEFC